MTTNVLKINSSIFSEQGVSSTLTNQFIEQLCEQLEGVVVTERDLAKQPIAHFDSAIISDIQEGRVNIADSLIDEVQQADIIVLGVPMYNFGVPSTLKAWFDHIARANVTFQYTAEGPKGLLINKKVYVITTRGGIHKGTQSDSETEFLKTILGFLGLTDVKFIFAEGLNMSSKKETSFVQAENEVQHSVNQLVNNQEVA